ncbi:MAG: thiol:disulfide interchange protein DsbC [Campylobacterota bacterium]|nr:thiol:disulfide interchange protein DsbC [Campylobacterota bacterium]
MLLMQKLSATLLLCANVFAAGDAEILAYLKKGIASNPNVSNVEVGMNGKKAVPGMSGWQAYFVAIEADVKQGAETRHINQNGTYFISGDTIATELVNIKTGERYNDTMAPDFPAQFYTKNNLISGAANAKHKVVIFSDPLCPFCRRYVPETLSYMQKYPAVFGVYYFHYPLSTLHPAAATLTRAAIAAEQAGMENVTMRLYTVEVNVNEKDESKILEAFNKTFKTKFTLADIRRPSVVKQFESDQKVAQTAMISGTPTVFFNGKKDSSKNKYKEIKVK